MKSHPWEEGVTWPQLERIREWKANLLLIARQEMEHLGLVCNLLTAIGGSPHFRRPNFPYTTDHCPPHLRFGLQPFCEATVKRFLSFERLHVLELGETEHVPPTHGRVETIGTLYQKIRKGFQAVNQKNTHLFIGQSDAQVSNENLGLLTNNFDIHLLKVVDLESAIDVIDHILEAGGPTSHAGQESHYTILDAMLRELEHMCRENPEFEPARPVVPNPLIQSPHDVTEGITLLSHPDTLQAAVLFNRAYEVMMLMLTRFYAPADETQAELEGLMKTAFFPMMTAVIRPLGEILTLMPVHDDPSVATAGPSFAFFHNLFLQPFRRSAWVFLHEQLQEIAKLCELLCFKIAHSTEPWTENVYSRLVFLQENLEQISSNFERYMNLKQEYVQHLIKRIL